MLRRIAKSFAMALVIIASATVMPAQATTQADEACEFTRGIHRGWQLCRTFWTSYTYTDGREEVFIIGLDRAVWHIWQRSSGDAEWSGWASLKGRIHWPDAEGNGVLLHGRTTTDRPVIRVIWTDRAWWCNELVDVQGPRWKGWEPC